MTTVEWSEMAVPLPRRPKSELEKVAYVTITSHAHLFAIKITININVFQFLFSLFEQSLWQLPAMPLANVAIQLGKNRQVCD